ncbi:MAG TPA: 5-dehydro-2-deoxygluconokinase [Mycobacteriales bacterium]|jgi:5-dehydro-2-deoxygluconokinase|nr:5-dehydro-2-deoxygluconokinase [Mycobacteriales bacterium]
MGEAFDVITMGRSGVDIYPEQIGASLVDVTSFVKALGGSATNVAVASARYGWRTALISRTGADPFGQYVHKALSEFRVDDRWVTPVRAYPTPVTFCEIFPPDNFPIYFYRQPKAPDLEIFPEELDLDAIASAAVFWTTGTGLSREPSRSATLAALEARDRRSITVHDLDFRPVFWPSPDAATEWQREALSHASVAVGNLDEVEVAVGTRDPEAAADALLDLGVSLAIVKQGPAGVLGRTRGASVVVPPVEVEVVNGLGAGDAFGGALCHGLLSGWELERTLRFANAAGALVASRLLCSAAMPYEADVEKLLEESR